MVMLENLSLDGKVDFFKQYIRPVYTDCNMFTELDVSEMKSIFRDIKNVFPDIVYNESIDLVENHHLEGVYFRAYLDKKNGRRLVASEFSVSIKEFQTTNCLHRLIINQITKLRRDIRRHLVVYGASSIIEDVEPKVKKPTVKDPTSVFKQALKLSPEQQKFHDRWDEAMKKHMQKWREEKERDLESLMWGGRSNYPLTQMILRNFQSSRYNWEGCDLGKAKAEFLPVGKGLLPRLEDKPEDSEELLLIDLDD